MLPIRAEHERLKSRRAHIFHLITLRFHKHHSLSRFQRECRALESAFQNDLRNALTRLRITR